MCNQFYLPIVKPDNKTQRKCNNPCFSKFYTYKTSINEKEII